MPKYLLLLVCVSFAFSQNKISLEETIYSQLDKFVENPSSYELKKIEQSEKTFKPKTTPEIVAYFTLQYNIAYYQNQYGNTNKAIAYYENAWRLYQQHSLYQYEIIETCLQPLSELYIKTGEYETAENIIKQCYFLANKNNNNNLKYAAVLHLSIVYQATGKIDQAIDILYKTIQTEKLTKAQKGNLYGNLGANYMMRMKSSKAQKGDFLSAKKSFLTSIDLLQDDATQIDKKTNAYRNLAQLYLPTDSNKASEYFENARIFFNEIANKTPRQNSKFLLESAKINVLKNNYDKANQELYLIFKTLIPQYKTGLPNKNSLFAETVLLDALEIQSEIFLLQNQPKKAIQSYELCFHIETLFQSLLTYENSKIISQIRNRNRIEKCLSIYISLYQKEKKETYLEEAFILSEETKSTVLKNHLIHSATISKEEKLIQEQFQNWNNIILIEQQKATNANIDKINEAIKKQNELMLLLKSNSENKEIKKYEKINISKLYDKLKTENTLLVHYFSGQEKFFVFTINQDKIKLDYFLNDQKTTSQIVSFLEYFSNAQKATNNPVAYNRDGFSIYKLLKLPKKDKHKNLIIIPDGILNFIPFEALISSNTNTSNFAKMDYFLNHFIISYNSCTRFYIEAIPFKHSKETMLGVFPIFENSDLELTFSKNELAILQKNFDGKYLSKKEATFNNFKLYANNYSILHLSTHATSGDVFEPSAIRFYDKQAFYSEFYTLNIHPDLVVLSACETGLGKLYKSEGAISVARGFQFAGVQNLLFSLWSVNDFTTSHLMELFYKNIKNGDSYAVANHQSKIDFLKSEAIPSSKKSPYYWSAFVYYGTTEGKVSSTNSILWFSVITLITLVCLVLLFLYLKRTKN